MNYKVVLERKVTYAAVLEVTADNFENAKTKAVELADTVLPSAGFSHNVSWREVSSQTSLKSILQE